MNIIWNQNPLRTVVELDDVEKELLKLRIKINEHEERLWEIGMYIEDGQFFNLESARKLLDPLCWSDDFDEDVEESQIDRRVRILFEFYISALAEPHSGDCVCYPITCGKCVAENLVGIDTIPNLNKYSGSTINERFKKYGTLDAVIDSLEDYQPPSYDDSPSWHKFPREAFEAHFPRWEAEAKVALGWLRNYRDQHFTPHK